MRRALGIGQNDLVAGFHQRVQDEIFSPVPLEAFARIAEPGWWFAIMGGSDRYRRQVEDLGLDRVLFIDHHGGADAISRFLNTLDVFAHGRADGETFGTVFAEAMMHSKPCLSHFSPVANAQPETMGPAGMTANGVEDYAEKLGVLFGDEGTRARMGAKARPHAERYYGLDSCVRRLEQLYDGVLGRAAASAVEAPLAYGQSLIGCLIAGSVDDPTRAAHHVVAGPVPDEPVADLLRFLLEEGGVHHEAGSANSILAVSAATAVESHLHAPAGDDLDAIATTAELNNWEDRLLVHEAAAAQEVPLEHLRAASVVSLNHPAWAEELVPQLADGPVLLVRGAACPAGYLSRAVGARSLHRFGTGAGWTLCLHPERHRDVIERLPRWSRRRRAAAARRAVTLPLRAIARARPRLGALAYRLRRSLQL